VGGSSYADMLVTDVRLLCRFGNGRLASLWWGGVIGLHIDLVGEHVVLDYGDGQPVCLCGAQAPWSPSSPSPQGTASKRW